MNIVVCVKAVPDMESDFKIGSDRRNIENSHIVFKMNSFDEYAVEAALQLKEKFSGEVLIVSIGGEETKQVMRKAFAMGADRGILVNDSHCNDSDAIVVSKLLKAALLDFPYDLILTGVQAEDDTQSQVGPLLASALNIPHVTVVTHLETTDGKALQVKRELEGGAFEVVKLKAPALLTIQTGINNPRYPSLPGIMKAKKKEIKELTLSSLNLSPQNVGARGSLVERVSLEEPKVQSQAEILQGSAKEIARELLSKLKERKVF
ncbi:MAG: electron transfer flavoprotein subunit beta/FixA family protein [Deltaproteobacteria bacterium]|nr:electron transfer flavoprotein subunit beta/FixA family protein [Deltaproteobacteria bacterium]